ncbi:hypothetical protein PUN28_015402 [Cardiocondyla obscurior]|uniref:Ribosomal protein L34 n=1 Tax=Cardiocondyla obscurior TaxID=286306 RepID=A0AAW2EX69_9HYME
MFQTKVNYIFEATRGRISNKKRKQKILYGRELRGVLSLSSRVQVSRFRRRRDK